ncbi:MAG: hypothetical protein GY774_09650 [Planctomycetes bacterium]|nr:hypothetical protein [Planctomycetota bacterium]
MAPDIDEILNKYFVRDSDPIDITGEAVPSETSGNKVEYLVDGHVYFGSLRAEISKLLGGGENRFFYFASWHLGLVKGPSSGDIVIDPESDVLSAWRAELDIARPLEPFKLDDGSSGPFEPLIDQLEEMSESGVDVRGLVWLSPFILPSTEIKKNYSPIWITNLHSALSVAELRKRKGMEKKVVVSTLSHVLGSVHLKIVLCGDNEGIRAYITGLDFVSDRISSSEHTKFENQYWHDVAVKIEGPAADDIFEFYTKLWNDQVWNRDRYEFRVGKHTISTYVEGTHIIFPNIWPPLSEPGSHHVQVLRTLPQMNFGIFSTNTADINCFKRLAIGFDREPVTFENKGLFEFRFALGKAIANAQRYIYVEDQGFKSRELMGWINDRLQENSDLVVIMFYGQDPTDPLNDALPEVVNNHLIKDIEFPEMRIAFCTYLGVVVHSKVIIIDDQWACVGTANFMRRSLYTDIELSVGIVDGTSPTFAKELRIALWGEHCGLDKAMGEALLSDLDSSLDIWGFAAGEPSTAFLLDRIERMKLPFVASPVSQGTVEVNNGSDLVVGNEDTFWPAENVHGRAFKVVGEPYLYLIDKLAEVDPRKFRIKPAYLGPSGAGKQYKISKPGEWLVDTLPEFNEVQNDRINPDSRDTF